MELISSIGSSILKAWLSGLPLEHLTRTHRRKGSHLHMQYTAAAVNLKSEALKPGSAVGLLHHQLSNAGGLLGKQGTEG